METIGRDLHRQFPLHEMFVSPQGHGYGARDTQGPQVLVQDASARFPPSDFHPWLRETVAWAEAPEGGEGVQAWEAGPDETFWHRQQGLLQILKAYTLYRPEQGYCQAQGPVAAVLLMHLPPEVSDL